MRLAVTAFVGALTWTAGGPAASVTAVLCLGGAAASALRGFATREPFVPPYLGHLDEAAWCFLLGHAVLALGGA